MSFFFKIHKERFYTDCSLFPFRFGHNPNRSGIGTRKGKFEKKAQLNSSFSEENLEKEKMVGGDPRIEKTQAELGKS